MLMGSVGFLWIPTRNAPHLVGRHHLQRWTQAPRRARYGRHGELGTLAAEVPNGLVAEGMGTWPVAGTPIGLCENPQF